MSADDNKDKMVFICPPCEYETSNEADFLEHFRSHCTGEFLRCGVCGEISTCFRTMLKHKREHMGMKFLRCVRCGTSFLDLLEFKGHLLKCKKSKQAALRPGM